jgi:hypothetical protein
MLKRTALTESILAAGDERIAESQESGHITTGVVQL